MQPLSKRLRTVISDSEDEEVATVTSVPSSSVSVGVAKKRNIAKTEDDSVSLPDPFPLPKHYPQNVEVGLKRKKMSSKEKRFISDVASAMLWYKRYPSQADYHCVARAVVVAYPFLTGVQIWHYDAAFSANNTILVPRP